MRIAISWLTNKCSILFHFCCPSFIRHYTSKSESPLLDPILAGDHRKFIRNTGLGKRSEDVYNLKGYIRNLRLLNLKYKNDT